MKVLHVVPSYLPALRYGGPIASVHGLCRALVGAGHQVDVFTTSADGADDLDVALGERVDIDGVGVHYFPVTMPRRWFYSSAMALALRSRARNYDLVHLHALFLHPITAGADAAWAAKVPYLLSPRGMLVRSLFQQRSRWLKKLWITLAGRRVIERAAAVHVTSATERHDVTQFELRLPTIVEVANGIDCVQTGVTMYARDPNLVLFLGRLSWKKRIDRLIAAMVDCPRLTLAVIGNDDEGIEKQLRALAQRLQVAQRVQFVGPAHGKQKDEWYARAGMFVLASQSENFANTVLEAMAGGCAVIVTPGVGLSHVVDSSACGLVCEDSVEALSAAMRAIADNPKMAAQMGERGREVVRNGYLWPTIAAQMNAVYDNIIERGL